MALCIFVLLVAIFAPSCLGSDALVGGIQERKTDDPEVLDALDFAMNEFNAMQNNMFRFMATDVRDASFQVRPCLYGLGYPRQPSPRATLAELTFHLFL